MSNECTAVTRPRAGPHGSRSTTRRCATAAQLEGISLTVDDKLRIAEQLDWLGVDYIEAGLAGRQPEGRRAVPPRAAAELALDTSTLVAFGSTRRVKGKVDSDDTLRHLLDAGTSTVCIVGKSWDYHVLEALQTTLDEGVAMVADSVEFLHGRRAATCSSTPSTSSTATGATPSSALRVLEGAAQAGATPARAVRHQRRHAARTRSSGSSREVVDLLRRTTSASRVHLHDDAGTGVANALAGVRGGAIQVQGTINGYGERTGNCNLTTIIPNLTLKMGIETIPRRPARAAHAGRAPRRRAGEHGAQPAGGLRRRRRRSRTRRGCTSSAIVKRPDAYEHVPPDSVGNGTRFVVSELAGQEHARCSRPRSSGSTLDGPQVNELVDTLKRMEHEGYHFEVADASLELLMRRAAGWEQPLVRGRVVPGDHRRRTTRRRRPAASPPRPRSRCTSAASASIATAEGNGPVNALDTALRQALGGRYPALAAVHLTDYKVRVLDTAKGTGAVTRVLVDSTNGDRTWTTIGVSENIIEASWQALSDSLVYGLLQSRRTGGVALHPCPPTRSSPPSSTTTRARSPTSRRASHLPAGAGWRADRPGDLVAGQPTGTLLGRPGPERRVRASRSPSGSATRLTLGAARVTPTTRSR